MSWIAIWAFVLMNALFVICSSVNPVVDLGYAKYQGTFNRTSGISTFLGVRYASAPTGEYRSACSILASLIPKLLSSFRFTGKLRLQAPTAPPQLTNGIQLATVFPPECPQGSEGTAAISPSYLRKSKRQTVATTEDCLFLRYIFSVYFRMHSIS